MNRLQESFGNASLSSDYGNSSSSGVSTDGSSTSEFSDYHSVSEYSSSGEYLSDESDMDVSVDIPSDFRFFAEEDIIVVAKDGSYGCVQCDRWDNAEDRIYMRALKRSRQELEGAIKSTHRQIADTREALKEFGLLPRQHMSMLHRVQRLQNSLKNLDYQYMTVNTEIRTVCRKFVNRMAYFAKLECCVCDTL